MKIIEKNISFESLEHEKAWFIRVTINLTKNIKDSAWNKRVVRLDENIVFATEEENEVYGVVCKLPQNYRTVI